jgi:hypothetical protein
LVLLPRQLLRLFSIDAFSPKTLHTLPISRSVMGMQSPVPLSSHKEEYEDISQGRSGRRFHYQHNNSRVRRTKPDRHSTSQARNFARLQESRHQRDQLCDEF